MPIEIIETDYGYRSISSDPVNLDDILDMAVKVKSIIQGRSSFCQFAEVHKETYFKDPPEVVAAVMDLMEYVIKNGLKRSVVIVPSRKIALKLIQMSFNSGMLEWERYIAFTNPDWESFALDWLLKGIDPDNRTPNPAS